ncbi:MAG: hypothetical protein H7A21_06490 [Spirochaetales bacterium]|nr:hypothetical protein [Leptospiraceae bacterium]MCP5481061.1 hypothetical protein [Spirochaetales bacterium]MCP5485441.1 hypothetical protein [Spirochaetales bacterium]
MRFLITGALRAAGGPRKLLSLALIGFGLFVLSRATLDLAELGLTPETVRGALHRDSGVAAGWLPALERLHVDLFLYSTLALFLSALLVQARLSPRTRQSLVYLVFVIPFCGALVRLLAYPLSGAAFVYAWFWPLITLFLLLVILGLLRDLWKNPGQP